MNEEHDNGPPGDRCGLALGEMPHMSTTCSDEGHEPEQKIATWTEHERYYPVPWVGQLIYYTMLRSEASHRLSFWTVSYIMYIGIHDKVANTHLSRSVVRDPQ